MILTHADLKHVSEQSLSRIVDFVNHHDDLYPPGTGNKILQTRVDPLSYVDLPGISRGIRTLVVLQAGLTEKESARDIELGYGKTE